jgi:hypothetical protein
MALGLTHPLTEMSNRNISGDVKASTSLKPQGLSRPVVWLIYLNITVRGYDIEVTVACNETTA